MSHPALRTVLTLLAAGLGWAGAMALGLPAPALIGSTLAIAVLAFAGAAVLTPDRLRDLAFCTLGVTLGAGVTPEILSDMARWPVSLALLVVALAAMTASSVLLLRHVFGHSTETALLAAAPGALSMVLALAAEGRGDVRAVMVMQSIRLAAITLGLPLLLSAMAAPAPAAGLALVPAMGWPQTVVLLAVAFALSLGAARLRVPAAYLVAGLALSSVLHVAGVLHGRPPEPLVAVALAITGAVIGARFRGVTLRELARHGFAALCSTTLAAAIALLGAVTAAALLGLSVGQVWITYAPGGVEAMAAMALALGYDPAFVAAHHILRIMLLILVLPLLLRRVAG